ncbi:MAG: DnaD domain protein [Bacilli bacterium]|nr:DnaD domain protein [Bacilli bacterium]
MDDKLYELISEKPFFIPKILINNYVRLNITDTELIIIMVILSKGNKIVYDPVSIANEINMEKMKVMENISNLLDKNIISLVVEKKNQKRIECLSLELLYKRLINIIKEVPSEEREISSSVFEVFESELGKTLSPMQYEIIKEWISKGISEELIIEALKEAVINGINNFRYIDTIITSWMDKGYKTKNDVLKDKENYHKKSKKEVFSTDWLNNE